MRFSPLEFEFEGDLPKPAWVKKAQELINSRRDNALRPVSLEVTYNRVGVAMSARWLARLFPVERLARIFGALQDHSYLVEVAPPATHAEVFQNCRLVILRPAPTFELWAKEVAPGCGRGSFLNRRSDGVPAHWRVNGWFYDLRSKESLPRLIVRQPSSVARYDGLYHLAGFHRESGRYSRKIVRLHRNEVSFGKTNPYLYRYCPPDASLDSFEFEPELIKNWQAELLEVRRSRRDLFALHRKEAALWRLAVRKLPKSSSRF
jgi:hypothetical protein